MKYIKTYESVKDFLKPKSEGEIGDELYKLPPDKILDKSIRYNFLSGLKYLIDNNLVDEITKYLIEKYKLGLHQNEPPKDYEKWLLSKLINLSMIRSNTNPNYIKLVNKENELLFIYNSRNNSFEYSYNNIYKFLEYFKLNYSQMNILVELLVEKYLKIRINSIERTHQYS